MPFGDKDRPVKSGPQLRMDDGCGNTLIACLSCDGSPSLFLMRDDGRNSHPVYHIADNRAELLAVRAFINRALKEL